MVFRILCLGRNRSSDPVYFSIEPDGGRKGSAACGERIFGSWLWGAFYLVMDCTHQEMIR